MQPAMMRPAEVARLFAVSPSLIYRMIARGELRAARIGGAVRIPREAVEAILCPAPTEAPTCGDPEAQPARGSSVSSAAVVPIRDRQERRIVEMLKSSSRGLS